MTSRVSPYRKTTDNHPSQRLYPLNQLLKPRGFRLLAANKGAVVVAGEGFRQEAITAIYGYFSAKRKRSQSGVEAD